MYLFSYGALIPEVVGVDGEELPLAVGRQPKASAEHAVADWRDEFAIIIKHLKKKI